MNIKKTKFKDLLIYEKIYFSDKRGYFLELFKDNNFKKKFPFTCFSYSKKNVLRGLHIQTKNTQGKFMSVLKGRVLDVALDLRAKSKTFGKHFMIELSEKNSKSIYIPPGFAHGFCALDKENYVTYSCSQYRSARSEKAIKYNDKKLNIKWPIKKLIVSKKDQKAITFIKFKKKYL